MKCKNVEVIQVNIFDDTQAPFYKNDLHKAINNRLEDFPEKELIKIFVKEEVAYIVLGGEK